MKTLFIAAGPLSWASSRYRAWWTAEALQKMGYEADCQQYQNVIAAPEAFRGYDNYIWQKNFGMEALGILGGRHYYDACDPSWWWIPDEIRQIAARATAVVCSSEALTADFVNWVGKGWTARHIPDRFKMEHFTRQKSHEDTTPVRFIWFGIAVNRIALYGALANLERLVANGHEIELTICDDRPDAVFQGTNAFPIYHTRWTLESEVEVVTNHDIAILPPYPGPWGKVKSSNKKDLAHLCNLPVWDGEIYELGRRLVSEFEYRRQCGSYKYHDLSIDNSARDWLRVFEEAA